MPNSQPELQATSSEPQDNRQEWIEPSVVQLDVRETALNPARGLDYGSLYRTGPRYPDCTRS